MKPYVLLLALLVAAAPALAQHRQGQPARGQQMSHEERQRLRQDVDSARGNYNRRDAQRPQRMAPEERQKLRQDVQDANRSMPKR
jgi:hypothetical protein